MSNLVERISKLDWDITSSEEAKAALKVLSLIKEVPASEIDKLEVIMNGFGKVGVLAWIDEVEASRKKETTANITNYNVNAGGKLNIYIGGSSSDKRASSSGSRSNAKSKGWQVKEGKAYLSDPWIALVRSVKSEGRQFKVESGQQWQYISFKGKAGTKLGGDAYSVAGFTVNEPAALDSKMVSVHTSNVLAGQGPEGFIILAKALYDEAKEKGFVKEGREEVKASSDEPVAEESTTKADRVVDSLDDFELDGTGFSL